MGGHAFRLQTGAQDRIVCDLRPYEPFAVAPTENTVFSLLIADSPITEGGFTEEIRQQEKGLEIAIGYQVSGEPRFDFWRLGKRAAVLVAKADYSSGQVFLEGDRQFGINNTLIVMYALATANSRTALFHSSAVSCQGRGYMFLGVSGTGKSTHSGLWLRHVGGSELLNDDNPVVRIHDGGEVRVIRG